MVEDLSLHVADLVLNSLRAGAKRIEVSLERKGDRLTLEVADDGRGMTEAELARALDPFFTTKDAPHGIGLGLALVRQTAEELGGELRVDSAPGRGTRVRLSIPYRHPDRPPLGDLAGTLASLVISAGEVEFHIRLVDDRGAWELEPAQLRTAGGAIAPGALSRLEERIRDGLRLVGLKEDA
jgi:hypothetical protein